MLSYSFDSTLESANVRNIPTSKATQMIIGAMQSCEKYDDTSNEAFHANLISGYPRDMSDMKDYMSKVRLIQSNLFLFLIRFIKC